MFKPKGVIPALVTPLDKNGQLMEDALRKVIDYTIAGGVHGLFVLGSSGEIYGLTPEQKRRVVEVTVDHTAGRVPVYCGASEITTKDCIQTAQMIEEIGGVAALSVLTPYFMTPIQTELADHFKAIAKSTNLPIILYGNEARTQVKMDVKTCEELSKVDNIIGIKDSSGDMTKAAEYLRVTDRESFSVLLGRDTLIYAGLCHGATGAIASTGNIAPKLVSDIYNTFVAGDYQKSLELQFKLAPLRLAVDKATFPVVLKEGLRMVGIDVGYAFGPAAEMNPESKTILENVLKDLELYQIY
ncbi:4-hydroxy-tetrahydrodipicolinate synthase [Neobacillus cucumis]|uniref:4-hydroxy-tetrahydrodipicolinate synthase n=1 Tax=Neobacillus cucumis TaxID=1740721 RepID=UPI002E2440B8|nr:4-hydroxy-tetrahydrodipicolinate synthase [Neobacillus cucumis]MED4225000.1 4-hydroxy-tetrahydrodipicolinate synthase [Neobacillus cucumis]